LHPATIGGTISASIPGNDQILFLQGLIIPIQREKGVGV